MGTQIDTGLGWSADSQWLVSSPTSLGYILDYMHWDDPTWGNQNIPVTTQDAASTVAGGLLFESYISNRASYKRYVSANKPGAIICCFTNPPSISSVTLVIVPDDSYTIYYAQTEGDNIQTGLSGFWTINSATVSGDLVYYTGNSTTGGTATDLVFNALQFPYIDRDITHALAYAYSYVIPGEENYFYKVNPGYAVACVAEWYTPEGNILISPVLISSDSSAIIIGNTPTTTDPHMTTFNFLYDGLWFYMAIIGGNDSDITTNLQYANLTQFGAALPSKVFSLIASESFSNIIVLEAPDPYGDTAEEDGGEQTDPEDDPVEEETMPIPAVVGLGFSTVYVPTQTDLFNLAAYLWGGNLDLDNFLRLFANPMDSILGLSAVPLVLSGTYEPIYLGGQLLQGITMPRYTGRTAVKVDMGTATITERWGSYLDYDPYTELAVYVPFVGIKNIKADDVMGKTIRLMYDIDILSGACIAYIRPEGGSPLYEWSGQCAMQIPITGANWDNIFNTAINTAATLGGALFAPASAPVLGGAVASAASQAIAAKPRIERSGAMNGVTGFLGQLRPYIIRAIPEAYIPNDQNKFIGYPSYVSVNLGSLTGYNEIASIHLENIPATGDELSELESILKGGVIF